MNRLAVPAASHTPWTHLIPDPPAGGAESLLATSSVGKSIDSPVATFVPLNYEPGYAYPLLVWLHESRGNERHLPQVMQHLSTQNFVAVAPRGSHPASDTDRGYCWQQQPQAIEAANEAVNEAIELAHAEFHIHTERVFLVGQGEGGSMAMRLAMECPERYAGVATINGKLPRRHGLLRNINRLRSLPFFIASARQFAGYPEVDICRDLRLLHSAGCSVALRQYPGDDDLTTCMLTDVNRWIMDQVCTR